MGRYCCVPFCESTDYKKSDKGLSFHEFPCDLDLRMLWLENIRRQDPDTGLPWVPRELSVVCGLHFSEDQFKKGLAKRILKPKAVPTIFPKYPSYIQKDILRKSKRCIISNNSKKPKKISSVILPGRLHRKKKNRPFIVKCNSNNTKTISVEKTFELENKSIEVSELEEEYVNEGTHKIGYFAENDDEHNIHNNESISNCEFSTTSTDEHEHSSLKMCVEKNDEELRIAKERIQILEERIHFLETENKKLLKDNECLTKMLCARI